MNDDFEMFTEQKRDRVNWLVRARISSRKVGRGKSEKILKVIRKVRKISIAERVNIVIVANFLGAWAIKKCMLKRVRGVLKATGAAIIPGIVGEMTIVVFVLGVLKDTDAGTKKTILELKGWKPILWFRELKVSLLIKGVGGVVELRARKPIKRSTGVFNQTEEVVVEMDVRCGGTGPFVKRQSELGIDGVTKEKLEFFTGHSESFIRKNSRTKNTGNKRGNATKGSLSIRVVLV